ncbi:MAG: hypothetical protein SVK08_00635 [Halobacteriota archaeon]|nr:hypothetical protein [Halobacteriota archaeon]
MQRSWQERFKSRKFILACVAALFSAVATMGFEVPVEEVLVTDAIVAVWILAEAMTDAVKR